MTDKYPTVAWTIITSSYFSVYTHNCHSNSSLLSSYFSVYTHNCHSNSSLSSSYFSVYTHNCHSNSGLSDVCWLRKIKHSTWSWFSTAASSSYQMCLLRQLYSCTSAVAIRFVTFRANICWWNFSVLEDDLVCCISGFVSNRHFMLKLKFRHIDISVEVIKHSKLRNKCCC